MKIKETLQSIFGFILLLSPIILFWYIDWYWVLIIYNIYFIYMTYFLYRIYDDDKENYRRKLSLPFSLLLPLLFGIIGLVISILYSHEKISEYEKNINSKSEKPSDALKDSINQPSKFSDGIDNDTKENPGHEIYLMTEGKTFFYEDKNGNEMSFEADALIVECPDFEDLESKVKDAVGKQILISSEEDHTPKVIVDLPEIIDEDISGGALVNLNDKPLRSVEEAINYIKNLKTISFKIIELLDNVDREIEAETQVKKITHEKELIQELGKRNETHTKDDYHKEAFKIWKSFFEQKFNDYFEVKNGEKDYDALTVDETEGFEIGQEAQSVLYGDLELDSVNFFYYYMEDEDTDGMGITFPFRYINDEPYLIYNFPNKYDEMTAKSSGSFYEMGDAWGSLNKVCKYLSELKVLDFDKLSQDEINEIFKPKRDDYW